MDFDTRVKLTIYRAIAQTGVAPTVAQLAAALEVAASTVRGSLQNLFAKRLLVLEPDSSEIRMAPPFSAVPTSFRVAVGDVSYFANCVWDAFGIAAALHRDADGSTTCGCCDFPMTLAVRDGVPVPTEGVGHFAVPAAHWWDDIVFT